MSILELKVTADSAGLTQIKMATAELKQVIASARLAGITDFKAQATATRGLQSATASASSAQQKLNSKIKDGARESAVAAKRANTLRDATRGVAGATGHLWFAYGQLLPLMAAFAVTSASIKGIGLAADFEYQTKYTNVLAEATGDYTVSLIDLRQELMGIRGVTDSPAALAEASKELVKAGFSSAQAISEIAEMSKTATVVQEDLELVTRGVAAQYRAWNVEAVGAERGVANLSQAANMMSYAALASATDFGELNQMLAYTTELGPLTAASFSEILAALSHMTNMGIRGTKAATALRTAILKLQNPTDGLTKEMERLRIPFSAFTEAGEKKGLTQMFEDLNKSLASLNTQARTTMIQDLFGLRSMKGGVAMAQAMSRAVSEGKFSFRGLSESIEDAGDNLSYVNDMFTELEDTTKLQWELLKADTAREMSAAYMDANGAVQELIRTLREMVNDGSLYRFLSITALITKRLVQAADKAAAVADFMTKAAAITPQGIAVEFAEEYSGILEELRELGRDPGTALSDRLSDNKSIIDSPPDERGWFARIFNPTPEDIANERQWIINSTKRILGFYDEIDARAEKSRLITDPYEAAFGPGDPVTTWDTYTPDYEEAFGRGDAVTFDQGDEERYDAKKARARREWEKAELRYRAEHLANMYKLQEASFTAEGKLYDAQYAAREISESAHIDKSNELRLKDISAQIKQAESLLGIKEEAYVLAEENTWANPDEASAVKEEARALSELNRVATELIILKQLFKSEEGLITLNDIARVKSFEDSLQSVLDVANKKEADSALQLDHAALSDNEARYLEALAAIDTAREIALRDLHDKKVAYTDEEYRTVIEGFEAQLAAERRLYEDRKQLQQQWLDGAKKAIANYVEAAKNDYANVQHATTNALNTMEDAFVEFARTGKLNWRDMIESMIDDINRLVYKKIIAGLLTNTITNWATPTATDSTFSVAGAAEATNYWTYPTNADGGVYSGAAGLSAYSGSIVNRPTLFAFAAGMGIMGEEGDEAILPLKRGSDGKLGVTAQMRERERQRVQINVYNQGGEEKQATANTKFDLHGMVVDIVLSDVGDNGPITRSMKLATTGGL